MFCMWSRCISLLFLLSIHHPYESPHLFNMFFPEAQHDLFVPVTQRLSQSVVKYSDVYRQNVERLITHIVIFFFVFPFL